MTAFVEECRREWKRLGVPDLIADEMATDLEADLTEAQADGVSAAEVLGESDPRLFAETWASERGLIAKAPPKKSRKRFWILVAVGLLFVGFLLGIGGVAFLATPSVNVSLRPTKVQPVVPIHAARVPTLLGLKACHAERIARAQGFRVHRVPPSSCDAVVITQSPAADAIVPRHSSVTLRLRRR